MYGGTDFGNLCSRNLLIVENNQISNISSRDNRAYIYIYELTMTLTNFKRPAEVQAKKENLYTKKGKQTQSPMLT